MAASWLDRYLDYTHHQVSPEIYHRWCGLTVVAAALERRVWLRRGYDTLRIFPGQIMTVLVGRSALAKKTTAVNMAVDLLKHLPIEFFHLLPKKTSPQQLLSDMPRVDADSGLYIRYPEGHPRAGKRVNSSGFIASGELSVFFSTDHFNETLASTINDLNDAESGKVEVKFRQWKVSLWNPVIGLLGGITPKGIATELPKAARSAGFFGRILWVYAGGTDRGNPMTDPIPENRALKEELKAGITAMSQCYGPAAFTKQAKAWFEHWYWEEYHKRLLWMDAQAMVDTSGYWGRKDGHLLRVAMTCMASRSWGQERWIRQRDLEEAAGYLTEIERGFDKAMAEIGISPLAEENTRLLGFIEERGRRSEGWVPQRDIFRFANGLGMRRNQLDDALGRLGDAGDLTWRLKGGERWWKRQMSHGELMRRTGEEGAGKRDVWEAPPALTLVRGRKRLAGTVRG